MKTIMGVRLQGILRTKAFKKLACSGFALVAGVGCLDGQQDKPGPPAPQGTLQLVSYDTTTATLLARGQLNVSGLTTKMLVQFFIDSSCSGTPVGQGFVSDLAGSGVTVTIASPNPASIYAMPVGLQSCQLFGSYDALHAAPPPPVFLSTNPASPSNVTNQPMVVGIVSPFASKVKIFSDSSCTTPVGAGTGAAFNTVGVLVLLPTNATTSLYAQSAEAFGNSSACTYLTSYTHSKLVLASPAVVSVTPQSPSSASITPIIVGTVDPAAVVVTFYSDSSCQTQLANGIATAFQGGGIQVKVAQNATTQIYAVASDANKNQSVCQLLTSFTNSTIGPAHAPVFVSGSPGFDSPTDAACVSTPCYCASPAGTCVTNQTTAPQIVGTSQSTAADGVTTVKLYRDAACTKEIGSGTLSAFLSGGITANIIPRSTTPIFAASFDSAGNNSLCNFLVNYVHNDLKPGKPEYDTILPGPYSNSTTAVTLKGSFDASTSNALYVNFYDDSNCQTFLASGSASDFLNNGIISIPTTLNAVTANTKYSTDIYATSQDAEGNLSDCNYQTTFSFSNVKAIAPAFVQTVPASPSRFTSSPSIIGSADPSIKSVTFYSDSACQSPLASGTRAAFTGVGIPVTVGNNSRTTLYAVAQDVYLNHSDCTPMINPSCTGSDPIPGSCTYVYETRPPLAPVFGGINPHVTGNVTQPLANNYNTQPVLFGSVPNDPFNFALNASQVKFYDSICVGTPLGTGTPSAFSSGTGVTVGVPIWSQVTAIMAQAVDAAGNVSACSPMTNYVYDIEKPGAPAFNVAVPASPSYSLVTKISGTIGSSTDTGIFPMNDTNYTVALYSDSNCQQPLSSAAPSVFAGTGISTLMPENQTTTVYGAVFDLIGNVSSCTFITNFQQADVGPANLAAMLSSNGTVSLSWSADMVARPTPTYIVKRALKSGGPYTVLSWSNTTPNFNDVNVTNGQTYYYVVAATNGTGTSKNSSEVTVTVNAPNPDVITSGSLVATPGYSQVSLTWGGDGTDYSYQVLRATQTGGPYTVIATNQLTGSYTDYGTTSNPLVNGTTYYYVVVSTNPSGDSAQSNEANATPLGQPNAPANLSVAPVAYASQCGGPAVRLTWSSPSYFTSFVASRSSTSGAELPFNCVAGTANTCFDCNPLWYGYSNFYNYYTVQAFWGSSRSSSSNEAVFANNNNPVVTVQAGHGEVVLSWINNTVLASGYNLLRAPQAGGPYTQIATGVSQGYYTDSGLTDGTAYYYMIQTVYPNGAISWISPEYSAMPGTAPPPPTNLVVYMDVLKYAHLSWSPPASYDSFNVYASTDGVTYNLLTPSPVLTSTLTNPYYVDMASPTGKIYYKVTANWGNIETAASNVAVYYHGVPSMAAATTNTSSIKLTWLAVSGATDYTIFRSTTYGTGFSTYSTTALTAFTDSGVTAGVGYFYYVVANFSGGSGEPSTQVSGTAPGASPTNIPSGLTVIGTTSTSASLAWAPIKSASSYKVYGAVSSSGPYSYVATTTTPQYTASGLTSGNTYYVKVTSVVSGVESAKSSYVAATANGAFPAAPIPVPGNGSVSLSWNSAPGAQSYTLSRSTDGVNFSPLTTGNCVSTSVTNCTDNTVTNGLQYFYLVVASFLNGPSTSSSASIGVTPGLVSAAPSGLTVTGNNNGTDLNLTWATVANATGYNIYQATTSGGYSGSPTSSTVGNNATAVDMGGLTAGTMYYFKVTALIGSYESSMSSEVQGMPLVQPAAPSVVVATGNSNVNVSWSTVVTTPPVTSYDLQRSSDGVNFTSVATVNAPQTSYTDTTAVPATPYIYRYLPYINSLGLAMSVASAQFVSTGTAPLTPPNLAGSVDALNNVYLSWGNTPNTVSYNIYRSSTNGVWSSTPYATTMVPQITYTDANAAVATPFYYAVTAVNASGAESPKSNILAISSMSVPGLPTASVGGNAITVSWTSTGAASYIVRRQTVQTPAASGYGVVGTVNGMSFVDNTVANGVTYRYVVDSVSASGVVSPDSPPVTATAVVALDLEVPIELADQGVASDVRAITFGRTQTSLDPAAYAVAAGGSITYSFEIVAMNADTSARTVSLLNSSGTVVASITVPAGTLVPTRMRNVFSQVPGVEDTYFVSLPATTAAYQLVVPTARMIVTQVKATKTKIYIPLLSASSDPVNGDAAMPVDSTTATSYQQLANSSIYKRDTGVFTGLLEEDAWELETITAAAGGASGVVGLYDLTRGTVVTDTETIFSSAGESLVQAPFGEGITNFVAPTNEGDQYQVSMYCTSNCSIGSVAIYKAGLWVSLASMTKVELYLRLSKGAMVFSTQTVDGSRGYVNLTSYSNSAVYFQAVGAETASDSTDVNLLDLGATDSGLTPSTNVSGSDLAFSSTNATWLRSGALTLTSGHSYLPQAAPTSQNYRLIDSSLVIDISR